MDYRDIIMIEPRKRSGKPCIRRMRITGLMHLLKKHYIVYALDA